MTQAISVQTLEKEIKDIKKHMVTKEEIESLIDTVEILSNPATMKSIRKSLKELDAGEGRPIEHVSDLL